MKRSELYMETEMLSDLDEIAAENEISRAEVVRTLVDYGLEHQDEIDFGEEEEEEPEEEEEETEDLEDEEDEPEEEEEED